jgi:hypothetical protein
MLPFFLLVFQYGEPGQKGEPPVPHSLHLSKQIQHVFLGTQN